MNIKKQLVKVYNAYRDKWEEVSISTIGILNMRSEGYLVRIRNGTFDDRAPTCDEVNDALTYFLGSIRRSGIDFRLHGGGFPL